MKLLPIVAANCCCCWLLAAGGGGGRACGCAAGEGEDSTNGGREPWRPGLLAAFGTGLLVGGGGGGTWAGLLGVPLCIGGVELPELGLGERLGDEF